MKRLDVTLARLYLLRERIDRQQLDADDWPIVGALVSKVIDRAEAQQERMLQKLAQAAADEISAIDAEPANPTADAEPANPIAPSPDAAPAGQEPESSGDVPEGEPKPTPKGHGRNGAAAFVNAKHVLHNLAAGILGALCAACGLARMSRYREKVVVRVIGQPLFSAEVHPFEQVRCRVCGRIVRADGPVGFQEGVGTSYIVYDGSACAMLIVMHYFAGAPFKRLESLHDGWGVPMPDANQWNLVDAADDLLVPLYRALERYGIQNATSLRIDDTASMVIAIAREIQAEISVLESIGESAKDVRTGINATGLVLETEAGRVTLFYTGRHHAGEVIDQLLQLRRPSPARPKLVKVTDGASKNFDHPHADELIESTCNAHAFLKFRAIKDTYPNEYALAAEVYKKVFDHDDEAAARKLTPVERMDFHRTHSKPLMLRLKAMCEDKLRRKLVEPNSALWEPLSFIINQWPRLTKFYEVPGVPLDTNLVEQTLIIPVRYLAGSFNYQTETGAEVGDRMMSLVATARANGVEPVAYLTDCLRDHRALADRPEEFLPWAYRSRLEHPPPEPALHSASS
jgi:transposase